MLVIENFLPKTLSDEIERTLTSNTFPWYGYDYTNGYSENGHSDLFLDSNTVDRRQLSHSLISRDHANSDYWSLFYPLLLFVETKTTFTPNMIDRAKVNFIPKNVDYPDNCYTAPHTDVLPENSKNCKTLIYYPIDSDGDTFIFDQTHNTHFEKLTINSRITPKKNTAVILDSCVFHASSPPKINDFRLTLNLVFYA